MSKAAELASLASASETALSNRNIVINGAMQVAQRGTDVAWASNGYLALDRFNTANNSTAGRFSMKQTADGPSGFANCLELDVTTADTSIAAAEHMVLQYKFEGQDLQQLKKGTSDAESFTISFYVKGNGNATYMCELFDRDNTRLIRQQFAVTSSWNRVELTFVGDTTGAFDDNNAHSLDIQFWLHAGSDFTSGTYTSNTWSGQTNTNRAVGISSIYSSTDNYIRITGLQMEVSPVATPFEHRSFGQELALCQRYYEKSYNQGTALATATEVGSFFAPGPVTGNLTTGQIGGSHTFAVSKRAAPTLVILDVAGNSGKCTRDNFAVGNAANSTVATAFSAESGFFVHSSGSFNACTIIYHYTADAEL